MAPEAKRTPSSSWEFYHHVLSFDPTTGLYEILWEKGDVSFIPSSLFRESCNYQNRVENKRVLEVGMEIFWWQKNMGFNQETARFRAKIRAIHNPRKDTFFPVETDTLFYPTWNDPIQVLNLADKKMYYLRDYTLVVGEDPSITSYGDSLKEQANRFLQEQRRKRPFFRDVIPEALNQ